MAEGFSYDPRELQWIASHFSGPVTLSRSQMIALRPDVHGATERARRAEIAHWHDLVQADLRADAASSTPLLGTGLDWHMPRGWNKPGTTEPDHLEACDWRAKLDSHCGCFRCWGQDISLKIARAILHPCADVASCYWCRTAADDKWPGDPYAAKARALAAAVKVGAAPKRKKRGGRRG